ncbi:MAG: hypothetical protein JWQ23_4087 [Herminiimonas sp.]|nr:hypothetical protein [Herminiimonas sp.]
MMIALFILPKAISLAQAINPCRADARSVALKPLLAERYVM